jgi:hypothetical protein
MDAQRITEAIAEFRHEFEQKVDGLSADPGELHVGLSRMGTGTLAEGNQVILAVLTELNEGSISGETRERLHELVSASGDDEAP